MGTGPKARVGPGNGLSRSLGLGLNAELGLDLVGLFGTKAGSGPEWVLGRGLGRVLSEDCIHSWVGA